MSPAQTASDASMDTLTRRTDGPVSPVLRPPAKRLPRSSSPRPHSPVVPPRPDSPLLHTSPPNPSASTNVAPFQSDAHDHSLPADNTHRLRPDSPAPLFRPDSPMPLRPDSPHPVLPMHQLNKMAANTPTDFSARPDMHSQPDVGATSPDINPNVTTDVPNDDRFVGQEDERMIDMASLDAIYSVQKMAEVLVAGPDSEREFILFELQQLLDHCLDDTMKILLPVLCKHVPYWNIDLQIKSAQRLFDVVCLDLEPATANMITCASFGVIQESKGKAAPEYEELYNLWGGILVDCLPNMKWTTQEVKDIVALVDIHAKESLYTSRKVAARVIGALAQCLDKTKVEKVILPRAVELFEDPDIEVRGTVVESLAFVGAALPLRVTEADVWPRIERLLEPPEEARLRATAMRTMAHILQSHRDKGGPGRLFRDLLPPVFTRLSVFARKFSAEDQRLVDDDTYLLLEVASEVFGQFAYSLALFSRKSFRKEAYKAYAGMATCNGPLIRRNCAFNLPGVAKALGERYSLELSGLCEYLAKDTDEEVRWILAAGIHETAALLAPRGNFERLFTAVCSLLQDENPMVRMNALAHFYDLLSAFARDGTDPASVRRLAPVFTDLTMLSEGEWRIQKSLAEQLGKCAEIIPADALLENVLPLLYRLTEQGTPLVREAAMDAMSKSLRNIPSTKDRNTAIEQYWKKAASGPFWMRLALLDGGASALKIFSYKRFAELFSGQMLQLAKDPVANVRIRVASILASMAPMCYGSPEYNEALEVLRKDSDMDVVSILQTHDERVKAKLKEAKETIVDDQNKYREEQEFYGFLPRTQKRARGRLNSARGNRIMLHVRRPSLEQSSGQLSVSKAVISAAKASSAAASVMKPGYHPKLAEVDSTAYLGSTLDDNDLEEPGLSPGYTSRTENGDMNGGESLLTTLARKPKPSSDSVHPKAPQPSSRAVANEQKILNGGVPVVQKTVGRAARYEARSKSWNGMLAQLPRQLSMESRSKRNAKAEGGDESGWGKTGKEGPKRTLSALRRKKKKRAETVDGDSSRARPVANSGSPLVSAEEFSISGPRLLAANTEAVGANGPGTGGDEILAGTVGTADFPSMSTISPEYSADGRPQPMSLRQHGRSASLDHRRPVIQGNGSRGNGATDGSSVPIVFESESGLPSFKGNAPWKRNKPPNEALISVPESPLENGSYQQTRTMMSSFHSSGEKVYGGKPSGSNSSVSAATAGSGGESLSSNGGGFFRGLFRKRR